MALTCTEINVNDHDISIIGSILKGEDKRPKNIVCIPNKPCTCKCQKCLLKELERMNLLYENERELREDMEGVAKHMTHSLDFVMDHPKIKKHHEICISRTRRNTKMDKSQENNWTNPGWKKDY